MKLWNEVWDYVKMFVIVIVVVLVVNNVVLINAKIPSESMEQTIMTGDRIFGFRMAYGINFDFFGKHISKKMKDPERYDIIVFPFEENGKKEHFIKRIIGLPGETVQIIDGYVYINGEKLESDIYGAEVMKNPGRAAEPITLGDDEYFVLGDNRNNSRDGRYPEVGNIKRSDITGRAFLRIWPLNKFGLLKHQ